MPDDHLLDEITTVQKSAKDDSGRHRIVENYVGDIYSTVDVQKL